MQLLRLELEPWSPVDVLSLGKLLAFGLSTNWERELLRADMVRALGPELAARLDPAYPADNPIVDQEPWNGDGTRRSPSRSTPCARSIGFATEASGSNNWAVSGALSATGSPLIAGDPHLPPSMPGIWYQIGAAPRTAASSAAPRCRGCPASTWARATTSAGPSPT